MPGHDIIVIGASAGGVEALAQLVENLPPVPAAIFVVLHIPAQGTSVLPTILNRRIKKQDKNASLYAIHPQDGEKIEQGKIYVAPPDHHLLIKNGYIRLARGPKENSHRPSVDPLFRTAARVYGSRVVGIVLSGTLDDGTAGLLAVKQQGGIAIVQNPEEAMYSGMPTSAIENVDIDYILPVAEIASLLVDLVDDLVVELPPSVSHDMEIETDIAELELGAMQMLDRPGTPSPFACPDCNGVLWEIDEGGVLRFRCRTGHAYSVNSLIAEQSEALEEALWNALRALEEKAALFERLAGRSRDRNQNLSAKRFEDQRQFAQQRATLIRQLLLKGNKDNLSTVTGQVVGEQLASSLGNNGSKKVNPGDLNIVAIGISDDAGVNALSEILSSLPAEFPAAITVVQHLKPQQFSQLLDILSQRTSMIVKQAQQGDSLVSGTIYIAPPDHHLLVNSDNTISLFSAELVHFARPSVDLLFESVAASFKQRAITVVLPGTDSNGAMGVQAIKTKGGIAIAQQATSGGVVPIAIDTGNVDWVVPLNEIAATLIKLLTEEREIEQKEIGGQIPLSHHPISLLPSDPS